MIKTFTKWVNEFRTFEPVRCGAAILATLTALSNLGVDLPDAVETRVKIYVALVTAVVVALQLLAGELIRKHVTPTARAAALAQDVPAVVQAVEALSHQVTADVTTYRRGRHAAPDTAEIPVIPTVPASVPTPAPAPAPAPVPVPDPAPAPAPVPVPVPEVPVVPEVPAAVQPSPIPSPAPAVEDTAQFAQITIEPVSVATAANAALADEPEPTPPGAEPILPGADAVVRVQPVVSLRVQPSRAS